MAKVADEYFLTDPWKVTERGFDPAYARVSESVFALSNEFMGVRGSFDEGGSADSLRGFYVNGVFEVQDLPKSYRGIIDKTHFMIPAADWLMTDISVDGEMLDLGKVTYDSFIRELDMRSGTLMRQFVWHTKSGKSLRLTFTRFLDMVHGERAYQRIVFEALNFSGNVEIQAGISFSVKHEGRNTCFWGESRCETDGDICAIQSRTLSSGKELFAAAQLSIPYSHPALHLRDGQARPLHSQLPTPHSVSERDCPHIHTPHSYPLNPKSYPLKNVLTLTQGVPLSVDKRVVIVFDDTEGETLWQTGQNALRKSLGVTLDEALKAQESYWEHYWKTSDIVISPSTQSDAEAVAMEQQGVRFCSFQMAQTYNGGSVRHNIGAKGLTGEAYNGHAFWDTEACCLPFYLFTNPTAAKTLLMFRYNTLPEAISRAKMLDCEGACYPIATLNGDEACDLWQHASLQFQPSTAVAYGIWHYVQVTGDYEFLWEYGAEMLLQIARLLVSRVAQNPHTGQFGYYGVMGPDEFHMMVNNNTYTNYMGKRSLEYAANVLLAMKAEKAEQYRVLMEKTKLREDEISAWRNVSENMALPMTDDGLIEQFDGYFSMPHIDIHAIPITEFPLYHHWSYDRIYRTDMIKQPDVLMFLYLYNSSFTDAVKRVNYEFYEPRTIHESSLSPAIHSILAAELGRMEEATDFFGYATRIDLDNYNRNTNEGLHTTSIAMAWVNIVYGFGGLRSDGEMLSFAPRLPKRWRQLTFSLTYKGRVIELEMQRNETVFRLHQGEQIDLLVYGKRYTLCADGLVVRELGVRS